MRSFPPPRSYKKNEMLYPDRCMLKYHGFLLSDHDEAMREDKAEAYGYQEEWDRLIKESLKFSLPLIITTSDNTYAGPILSLKDESLLIKEESYFHVIRREAVLSMEALNASFNEDTPTIEEGTDSFYSYEEKEDEPLDLFSFIKEEEKSLEDKPLSFDWDPWSVDF